MASFKTHLSFGIFLGAAAVAVATMYSLTTDNLLLALAFVFVIIGSLLPDLDSDESTPVKIVLTLFATLCALVAFLFIKQQQPGDVISQLFIFLLVYVAIKYGLGAILKSFTHHRGIFHSVPAALLSFFAGLLVLENFSLVPLEKLLVAGALAIGYLGHLILDEIKAATTFSGLRLRTSRSFGSGLKLFSKSKKASIVVYVLLLVAAYLNLPLLKYYYQLLTSLS